MPIYLLDMQLYWASKYGIKSFLHGWNLTKSVSKVLIAQDLLPEQMLSI